MTSIVQALLALRGVSRILATTVVAEVGDLPRFENQEKIIVFLGLVLPHLH
jgi:transposase